MFFFRLQHIRVLTSSTCGQFSVMVTGVPPDKYEISEGVHQSMWFKVSCVGGVRLKLNTIVFM